MRIYHFVAVQSEGEYIIISDCEEGDEQDEENLEARAGYELDSVINAEADRDIVSLPTDRELTAYAVDY